MVCTFLSCELGNPRLHLGRPGSAAQRPYSQRSSGAGWRRRQATHKGPDRNPTGVSKQHRGMSANLPRRVAMSEANLNHHPSEERVRMCISPFPSCLLSFFPPATSSFCTCSSLSPPCCCLYLRAQSPPLCRFPVSPFLPSRHVFSALLLRCPTPSRSPSASPPRCQSTPRATPAFAASVATRTIVTPARWHQTIAAAATTSRVLVVADATTKTSLATRLV